MTFVLRHVSSWGALLLWALFIPALLLIERQTLFGLEDALIVSVGLGIAYGYAKAAYDCLQSPAGGRKAGDAMIVGTFGAWLFIAVIFGLLWYWRLSGKTSHAIDGALSAFGRWALVWFGVLLLAAPGAVDGRLPPRSYLRVGVFIFIGLGAFLATVSFVASG